MISILLILASAAFGAGNVEELPSGTWGLKFALIGPSLDMQIESVDKKSLVVPKVQYRPRASSLTSLGFSYGPFGGSVSQVNPSSKEVIDYYGDSKVSDYQFRFFGKKYTFDFFYQYYSGYYVHNSEEIDPTLTSELPRLQRSDITNIHSGAQVLYNLNPDEYSLSAAYDQGARQKESDGSWFLMSSVSQTHLRMERPLIPSQVASDYGTYSAFEGGRFTSVRAGGGYGHNWIFGDWYISTLFALLFGGQNQSFSLGDEDFNRWVQSPGGSFKLGLGANGKKYFGGFQFFIDHNAVNINNVQLGMNTMQTSFFFGSRFFDLNVPFLDRLGAYLFGN
jgi:hypothetical protein